MSILSLSLLPSLIYHYYSCFISFSTHFPCSHRHPLCMSGVIGRWLCSQKELAPLPYLLSTNSGTVCLSPNGNMGFFLSSLFVFHLSLPGLYLTNPHCNSNGCFVSLDARLYHIIVVVFYKGLLDYYFINGVRLMVSSIKMLILVPRVIHPHSFSRVPRAVFLLSGHVYPLLQAGSRCSMLYNMLCWILTFPIVCLQGLSSLLFQCKLWLWV